MAMFDIESAKTVRLRDCATTSETVLKSSGEIGELDAERCKSGSVELSNKGFWRKAKAVATDNLLKIIVGGSISAIGAVVTAFYKST